MSWLFTEGDPLAAALSNLDIDAFSSLDIASMIADLPSLPGLSLNVSEFLAPGREWLRSRTTNFEVGREAARRGRTSTGDSIVSQS